jgi:hypothetical protein
MSRNRTRTSTESGGGRWLLSRFRKLLLSVSALLLGLGLGEAGTRLLLPQPGFHPFARKEDRLVPHPERGYAYEPGFEMHVETDDYSIYVRTNELGLRDGPVGERTEQFRVLALGDSFTFGFGVEASEAWPEQLEARLSAEIEPGSVRVINGGIAAYGPEQIRLTFLELADALRPDLVIVGLFLGDLKRVEDPFTYFHGYALRTSEIERLHPTSAGFLHSVFRDPLMKEIDFWLCRHFQLAAHVLRLAQHVRISLRDHGPKVVDHASFEKFEPMLREVRRLEEDARDRGIPLVIMLVNGQREDGSFGSETQKENEFVSNRLEAQGVRTFDPLPALVEVANGMPVFRNGGDYHWSPAAHAMATKALADYVLSEDLLREESQDAAR